MESRPYIDPHRNGISRRRQEGCELLLLTAVLSKRIGLNLSNQDVFVNVVGGLQVNEPAADLAVTMALASSYRNKPVAADLAIMGEVGLSGELRSIGQLDRRLREAAKLGFKRCLVPPLRGRDPADVGIEVIPARTVPEALEVALVGS